MDRKYTMEDVSVLARKCILLGKEKRPELQWIKRQCDLIQDRYHLRNKTETDRFLYERMYERPPKKDSEVLKIRYWRTGKYVPGSRKQCLLFGKALELSDEEMRYMMLVYCDRSEDIYVTVQDKSDEKYRKRQEYMRELIGAYVRNVPKERLDNLRIPGEKADMFFRHLYFTDAFYYIKSSFKANQAIMSKHITSLRYQSELIRQMRLCGEIPRKVFIRHLLILGMPDLTLEKLNHQLQFFGYLPLDEEHTMVRGERLDWLLINLFQMYEEMFGIENENRESGLLWFQKACQTLDGIFQEEGYPRLRFMYFKALKI